MIKKIITSAILCGIITVAWSQDSYPDLSYYATSSLKAGFTNFKITYGRPLQRGRELFGSFIPYGQRWRTGANGTTTIGFDTPVYLQETKIEAGTYALLTIPGEQEWEIILHRDSTMFTQRKDYRSADEVAHIRVKAEKSNYHQEALTLFTDIVDDNLKINLLWGFTHIHFTLRTGANEMTLNALQSKIEKSELKTADDFASGANFLAYNYSHLGPEAKDTALVLINKAITLDPQSWYFGIKRSIFWFSHDLPGIRKTTEEWIDFLQKRKQKGDPEDIQRLKDELLSFEKTMEE